MTSSTETGLSQVQQELLRLLSHQLFGGKELPGAHADWEAILAEARAQAVFPQAFLSAKSLLPDSLRRSCENRYYQYVSKNLNVIYAHHALHSLLSEAGIPYVVLKGCASARYYREPAARVMGDVDIYVSRDDLEAVDRLLLADGWRGEGKNHPNHWSYAQAGVEIEVHWRVTGVPTQGAEPVLEALKDLLKNARLGELEGQTMVLPDDRCHGLVILLHTVSHLTAGGVGLRHLLDWLAFVYSMEEEAFLTLLAEPLRRIKLWRVAQVLTAVGVHFLACPARSFCADVDRELTEALLTDILQGGNFGQKDLGRLNESKLLRDNESRRIGKGGSLTHALHFMNQKARELLPASARVPLLLPAGWAKAYFRHRKAVRKGLQTDLNLRQTLQGAKSRETVYAQLRLFEE